jgi:outer membrane protein OmpA-like peptidoglycan-associated protein
MKTTFRLLKSLPVAAILLLSYHPTDAQLLKRIKKKIAQTASDHVVNDAGNATDKAIDKTEDAVTKGGNSSSSGNSSNNSSGSSSDNSVAVASGNSAAPSIKSYQNYDFVPGDTVLFADDFTEDQDGEFPSHWTLQKGQAVVNTVAGKPSFCLTQGNYYHVSPRMKTAAYLGDAFTIEFDTYCDENNSEQGSPILDLTYTDKDGNSEDGGIEFNKGDLDGRGDVSLDNFPHGLSADMPEALRNAYPNNWHHCAIIYKNNQLKCYVDQYRILTVPNLDAIPTAFGFEGIGIQYHPTVITNVRLASGGNMNMIGKKFTEAKIVTHGITFDIDKSDIKPQSMGTLNMIVKVMKDNPDLKFEIDGHTDNTGQAAHNLTLSQQRAEAVKAQLIKMGIDGSRLTTKGFGDTKPISDNDSPEGKANNRRVEFVRR